ncbi:MAG: DUF1499 domain-containing protein [endosymbiont of Galathealinum brachiosum]|uniref:DUF1499 domain-containing protein n=1 Tax=endosymbiont of Galathealinum brachiosum TaxID=2200906 RepID=A0A370DJ25_9GAMM|nr:MAG: DUF1499 domain-containing protein [endosymbiont of Galathealinum brachiosum]
MKIMLIIIITTIVAGLFYFFYLGYKSQNGTAPGLVDSKLKHCSEKPNCICTEFVEDKLHFTDAIKFTEKSTAILINAIENTIQDTGGIIINQQADYIYATYTSSIFRYVDDFEIRIDNEKKLIHIRSASRVGHSDMGANLKRINQFKRIIGLL